MVNEDKSNIHYNFIKTGKDDNAFKYFISDVQTRLRNKFRLLWREFKDYHERGDKIEDYKTAMVNSEGINEIMQYTD